MKGHSAIFSEKEEKQDTYRDSITNIDDLRQATFGNEDSKDELETFLFSIKKDIIFCKTSNST